MSATQSTQRMADESFGRLIEKRRHSLGLTQEMVAKKVNVKANYIGYLERGMRHPSQKVVEKLSAALKLDSQELYLLANPEVRALPEKSKAAPSASAVQKPLRDSALLRQHDISPAMSHTSIIQPHGVEREAEEVMANAREWLDTPNDRFEGRPPRALLHTDEERRLRELIESIKHGMVA